MRNLVEIMKEVKRLPKKRVVIACAEEDEIQVAIDSMSQGLASFTLVGNEPVMRKIVTDKGSDENSFRFIHELSHQQAVLKAVEMVYCKEADIPMKGLMHTGEFVRGILTKEIGLGIGRKITQITVFDGYNGELQYLTDCAISLNPDLALKQVIIENAVEVMHQMGIKIPLVALLGSVETVNPAMQDTIDSAVLTQMNRRGQIKGCIIDGPLALDNAISEELATIKGIDSPVAGKAQLLVAPDLGMANTLSKSITHYAKIDSASIIAGTSSPVVMTSRTDKQQNKLYTIALACYLSKE